MTERLTHCAGCEIELRGQNEERRPGTSRRATKQLCASCYARMLRTGTTAIPRREALGWSDCKNCTRPMRPASVKVADHPGTIAHGKQGYCNSCTKQKKTTGEYGDPTAPRPCTDHMPAVINLDAPAADTLLAYMRGRKARIARAERLAVIHAKYGIAA